MRVINLSLVTSKITWKYSTFDVVSASEPLIVHKGTS
jgi:hypothetical protein